MKEVDLLGFVGQKLSQARPSHSHDRPQREWLGGDGVALRRHAARSTLKAIRNRRTERGFGSRRSEALERMVCLGAAGTVGDRSASPALLRPRSSARAAPWTAALRARCRCGRGRDPRLHLDSRLGADLVMFGRAEQSFEEPLLESRRQLWHRDSNSETVCLGRASRAGVPARRWCSRRERGPPRMPTAATVHRRRPRCKAWVALGVLFLVADQLVHGVQQFDDVLLRARPGRRSGT